MPFQIDELNDKFVEARDEIEYAQEDAETTYFNESHKLARESVGIVTTMYKEILADLSEADKGKLQRSMGMKMEQLKVHIRAARSMSFLSVNSVVLDVHHNCASKLLKHYYNLSAG